MENVAEVELFGHGATNLILLQLISVNFDVLVTFIHVDIGIHIFDIGTIVALLLLPGGSKQVDVAPTTRHNASQAA